MTARALIGMSHSPLLNFVDLPHDIDTELAAEFAAARDFAARFEPDLVVLFFPDHYNGFFYDMMPPACIALAADSIGDYDGLAGPIEVPEQTAAAIAQRVLDAGVDVAVSYAMQVDHGVAQPLETLFGALDSVPVIPVFINSVAPPFSPIRRVRALGQAIGTALADRSDRVLFVASGGLSHDPPVPRLATATEQQRQALLGGGRNLTSSARDARQQRVINAGRAFAEGTAEIQDLAPDWDRELLRILAAGELSVLDSWTPEQMTRTAGHSSHEVRTWIAAYSALSRTGPYRPVREYYRPIRELIAGFAVTLVEQ